MYANEGIVGDTTYDLIDYLVVRFVYNAHDFIESDANKRTKYLVKEKAG